MLAFELSSTVATKLDRALLARAARLALRGLHGQLSVHAVGDRLMRRINRERLRHDFTTDVLSFDLGPSPEGRVLELVICPPFAKRMARRHGIAVGQEIARYVVHGCLHLRGHDDHEPGERARMWAAQERILMRLFGRAYRPPVARAGAPAWRGVEETRAAAQTKPC
jgi:rRNA maturation RNase YbeY